MTLHFAPGYAHGPGGIAQFITTSFDDLLKCSSPVVGSADIHGRDIELRNAEVWLIDIYLLPLDVNHDIVVHDDVGLQSEGRTTTCEDPPSMRTNERRTA